MYGLYKGSRYESHVSPWHMSRKPEEKEKRRIKRANHNKKPALQLAMGLPQAEDSKSTSPIV